MKYVRKWSCAVCKQPVLIDTETWLQTCGCGVYQLPILYQANKHAKKALLEGYEKANP